MAERSPLRAERVAVVLTYLLPVLGGTIGIFWINATAHGSPLFGIAGGAVAGWILALALTRLLLRGSATGARGRGKTGHED